MARRSATREGGATRSYQEILAQQIEHGEQELDRQAGGLLTSGVSAGLDLGFSVLLMAVMVTLVGDEVPGSVREILVANMYAVGFIIVILGRSELFTEHTTLAVLPVLARRATIGQLGRLWGLIYASNLVGGAIFAALAVTIAPALGVADESAFVEIAEPLLDHPWWTVLLSAVLAGWLMGLLSWLVSAGRDTISQVVFVWLITFSIGIAKLHHSIAGTVEVLAGIFAGGPIGGADFLHFLVWTTLGNAIGGVVFVALIKYGHVMQAEPE